MYSDAGMDRLRQAPTPDYTTAPALPARGKTFGVLALFAAVVNVPLLAVLGKLPDLASAFVVWFGVFVLAAGTAGLAILARYRWNAPPSRPETYPGLMTGIAVLALCAVFMSF